LALLFFKAFSSQPYDLLLSGNAPCFGHECHLSCGIFRGRAAQSFGFPQTKNPGLDLRNGIFERSLHGVLR